MGLPLISVKEHLDPGTTTWEHNDFGCEGETRPGARETSFTHQGLPCLLLDPNHPDSVNWYDHAGHRGLVVNFLAWHLIALSGHLVMGLEQRLHLCERKRERGQREKEGTEKEGERENDSEIVRSTATALTILE